MNKFYQMANNCAEDAAFVDMDSVGEYLETVPYPQLNILSTDLYPIVFFFPCDFFPPSVVPDGFISPMESDIPTQLINGGLDIATPIRWARVANEELENSFLVEFENMGHVVTSLDGTGCAGSIAAFFNDPASEPNASCASSDAFAIQFDIPE